MRRLTRSHPLLGWLKLEGRDYQVTLDKLIEERDREDNPENSGPAPAFIEWVWGQQLPALAKRDFYKNQIMQAIDSKQDRINSLQEQIRRQAGALQEEAALIAIERLRLLEVLDGTEHDGGGA
ncbi:hypothetical protein SynWH8101_0788 [Synechococcus sp. WH 8101]|uniref:hypothetical protein n=1 Tax=Synechococcus sp. WH 8101 TaxID=59932 RepID=UPI0010238EDE|nr:hypothetical protein [Synechococcus sp. WH 8101]QBE68378.1 hypothetical protein SynWH8101_0788 [Synechococcus sp. WH 8101]QNI44591.1 hypothetical protein SynRCC2555_00803 [Synechococcus sp. WH 8101]